MKNSTKIQSDVEPIAEIYCDCGYIYSTKNEIHITVPVLKGQKLIVNGWEIDILSMPHDDVVV